MVQPGPSDIYAQAVSRWISRKSFADWPYLAGGDAADCAYIIDDGATRVGGYGGAQCSILIDSDLFCITTANNMLFTDGNTRYFTSKSVNGGPAIFTSTTGSLLSAKIVDTSRTETLHGTSYAVFDAFTLFIPPPNSLGSPPEALSLQEIPYDSPKVYCNSARIHRTGKSDVLVVHDQYWSKNPNSYAVAPMAQRRIIIEHTAGVTSKSSQLSEVQAALELDATASWATVSATLSASLSVTMQTSTEVTLFDEVSTVAEDIVRNTSQSPAYVILWQLTDVLTIIDLAENSSGAILSKIEVAQVPPIVRIYPAGVQFGEPAPIS